MERELTIGALASGGAALGGWAFREFAKWMLERQKRREEAEIEREKHERERSENDRADAAKVREELRSFLAAQVEDLQVRVKHLQEVLLKVTEEKAALSHRVSALQEEIEELRDSCSRCPAKVRA